MVRGLPSPIASTSSNPDCFFVEGNLGLSDSYLCCLGPEPTGPQSVVSGSASLGHLLEMQIQVFHPRPAELETLGWYMTVYGLKSLQGIVTWAPV